MDSVLIMYILALKSCTFAQRSLKAKNAVVPTAFGTLSSLPKNLSTRGSGSVGRCRSRTVSAEFCLYSGTPLLWTCWGPGEVSYIELISGVNLH